MKMAHITIMTVHLDESVEFYQSVVGLTIERDGRNNPDHRIVFLSNAAGETCVELVDNPAEAYSGAGISIGFEVEDAKEYREKLADCGYAVGEMISPNPSARFFFVNDPNGVAVQFVQEGL